MSPLYTGQGATARDLRTLRMLDPLTRGHISPLAAHFGPGNQRLMQADFVEASLENSDGQRFIICDDTKMGDPHICGD
jgi:hypothetical protein